MCGCFGDHRSERVGQQGRLDTGERDVTHEQGDRKAANRVMKTGIIGAALAAVCCATPILGILFAAVGLGALTRYFDSVLMAALVVFIGLAAYGYLKKVKTAKGAR